MQNRNRLTGIENKLTGTKEEKDRGTNQEFGINITHHCMQIGDFPGSAVVENVTAHAGDSRDVGSTPGLGRCPGGGNGNPLQCSCLGNLMDRGAWRATVQGSQRVRHN